MRKSQKLFVMCSLNAVMTIAAAVLILSPTPASAFDDEACNQKQCDGVNYCNYREGMNCDVSIFKAECLTKLC
jgi:hypothetical protein